MAGEDTISLKILVEASRAVSELNRAQAAAKGVAEEFEKLSEAEQKAVVEMARMQQAAREAAAEEQRIARYVAEASKLRKEETDAYQKAAREAAAETKRFATESAALARQSELLAKAIETTREETERLKSANDKNAHSLLESRSKLGLLTTAVDQLGDKIKQVSPFWGTMATTAVGSFARISAGVGLAIAALGGATMAIGRMAGEAERQERAVRLLGGAFDAVRDATNDTITAQQALTLQQGLLQSGLTVSSDQLAALTRRAREFALATGTDTEQALGQMLDTMRGLESEGLRRFGVTLHATGDRQRDFNGVVRQFASGSSEAEVQARKWGTALSQVDQNARTLRETLGSSQRTMSEEVERTSRSFTNMTNSIAGALARALDLNEVFQFWSQLFDSSQNQRAIDRQRQQMRAEDASTQRSNTRGALARLRAAGYNVSTLDQYAQSEGADLTELARIGGAARVAAQLAEGGASGEQVAAAMRGLGSMTGVQAMLRRQNTDDNRREMDRESEAKNKPRGSGEDSGVRQARAEYNRALAAAIVVGAPIVAISRNAGQTLEEYWQARARAQEQANRMQEAARTEQRQAAEQIAQQEEADETRRGLEQKTSLARQYQDEINAQARRSRIARRDQGTRRMAREQSLGGRVSSALGFATNDEGRIADFNGMQAGAELLTGTVNSLTNGLTNLFDTLVSGSADAGTAFQAFASGLLTELGKMAVNKGLFYTFEGIAALFSAPPAAPLYFAAGAGLLALGAGLGIAGAATRPQTPAAAADTSTARNLAPRSNNSGASARDLAPVTVVMSSLVPAGPSDAQRARNGLRDARRRGFADGNYAPRRVEH